MGKDPVSRALKISVGALVLALTGCVTLTPQQQDKVGEMQRFADRATALYGKPSLRISIQRATKLNIGAIYRQRNISASGAAKSRTTESKW